MVLIVDFEQKSPGASIRKSGKELFRKILEHFAFLYKTCFQVKLFYQITNG